MGKFRPEMYYQSVFDIDYEKLKTRGIKVLIFDLDNTIMTYDEINPRDEIVNLFQKLNTDFKVFLASNNVKEKVRRIGKYLNVHGFYSVIKPTKRIKKLLLQQYMVEMNEVVIIGDQLVTDIFLGNRLNMHTILVDPLGERDLKITYFNRFLENRILKRLGIKRGNYYD